jgi:uncharacterized membrane protein
MGKFIALLFTGILLICIVTAQNDSVDTIFSKAESITPPQAPSGALVGADRPEMARLLLVNAWNGSTISSVHVLIDVNSSYKTLSYVGPSGVLDLPFPGGTYTMTLKVDDIQTPGGDYYCTETLLLSNATEIRLFPVGSVRGTVRDKEHLVRNARVSFSCSGLYGETTLLQTDAYGSFLAQWLPLGNCTLQTTDGSKVGSVKVMIAEGGLEEVTILLERQVSSSIVIIVVAIFLFLAVVLLLHQSFRRRRIQKRPTLQASSQAKDGAYPKRLGDVAKTLTKKERDIIDIIYKEKEVTQAKIVYSLLLPKTSVIRNLSSLESKGIVAIQKYGKAKRIRLTDWILDKTDKKD